MANQETAYGLRPIGLVGSGEDRRQFPDLPF